MSGVDLLSCWAQFPIGAVVSIRKETGGSAAGTKGVVVDRLDDSIDGYARYCVAVEDCETGQKMKVDVCRCQLSRVHVGKGPRKRAMRRAVAKGGAK